MSRKILKVSCALGAAVLGVLLAPPAGRGQERELAVRPIEERQLEAPPVWGLLMDEAGGWRVPSPAEALAAMRGESNLMGAQSNIAPAIAVLRQRLQSYPRADLDTFANALVEILLADTEYPSRENDLQGDAFVVLAGALDEREDGTPYEAAFDALVRVYETRAARVLAEGGTDPFLEAHRRQLRRVGAMLGMALSRVYRADPEGRGRDYLRTVFAASEPPPRCQMAGDIPPNPAGSQPPLQKVENLCPNHSLWCEAARPFVYEPGALQPKRRASIDLDDPPDPQEYERLCEWGRSIIS